MSLKAMPKAFDLPYKKGDYPILFNTAGNLDYIGPYPEPKYYGVDFMSCEERTRFFGWYDKQKHQIFNNKEELLAYCMPDVSVSRTAASSFRNLFLKLVKMDPFRQAITISSICNKVLRTTFLKPDTVGLIPRGGYRMADRQSIEAIQWLAYIVRTKHDLMCAANGREVRLAGLPNLKVDGYSPSTNEVFEYLGCFWHGCRCLPYRHKSLGDNGDTLLGRYEETMARLQKIKDAGYNVVTIWGCEFRKMLRDTPGLENELRSHPYVQYAPLNIRDALYGGRTEATRMRYKVKQREEIHYLDICSLYPYITKRGEFPIGHPRVYVGEDCPADCLTREGVIKCKVLPPRRLYHPVLPYKSNAKLMFPLCSVCADTMNQRPCTHTDEERCITGTWIICEVVKAVEMGYSLVQVFQFWEYSVTQYNDTTKSGGLFAEYVNMFLKLKQKASGYPAWVQSEADKDKYIEDYRRAEGIALDKASIFKNPGQRTLAKLKLNSMWGKFAQNENKTQTTLVTSGKVLRGYNESWN
jgi:G:T-mismatch repair DNA endonuclease (very short patch repair protein)